VRRFRVEAQTADEEIVGLLERDWRWSAYALCDLEPENRPHARYVCARRDGRIEALALVYSPPGIDVLLPAGSRDGVRAVVAAMQGPPSTPLLSVREPDLGAVQERYETDHIWKMWRNTFFTPSMLEDGVYVGVRVDGSLVAVAGTHAISRRFSVACIGGVYTEPAYRGRGLAAAVTGAVA
jgi:hypothetical protein